MNNRDEQNYIHLEYCSRDLNSSWRTLHLVKQNTESPLASAALCYAIIEYARPFKRSYGIIPSETNSRILKLNESIIPSEYMELHAGLIGKRDQLLAHSDLTIREPQLTKFNTTVGPNFGWIENTSSVLDGIGTVTDIIELIETILPVLYNEIEEAKVSL